MKTRDWLTLLGIVFVAGFVLATLISLFVGEPNEFSVGPFKFEIPTGTPAAANENLEHPSIAVEHTTALPSADTVSTTTKPEREVPSTPEEAARKWGGQPEWWSRVESNGWKVNSPLTLTIGRGWRVDYTDPDGNIKSCGDTFEPGVYGPTTVNVTVATLWYVPGETECPSWTVWSQSQP